MRTLSMLSIKNLVYESIGKLLSDKKFPDNQILVEGVVGLISQIADYYEEGVRYYPEVVLLGSEDLLSLIPNRRVTIYDGVISADEFKKMMKLCSPLATNNWVIYICIEEDRLQYGLLSTEIEETSLALSKQFIDMAEESDSILYIRNIGSKNVEIMAVDSSLVVSLTLDNCVKTMDEDLAKLVDAIIEDCDDTIKEDRIVRPFILKLLKDALNEGHGNLIVVCKPENVDNAVENNMSGGALLKERIDIPRLIMDDKNNKLNKTSVSIKSYTAIIKSMINHDGITIFTSDGCLAGFHFIVNNSLVQEVKTVGGSRTKAFEALKGIDLLTARFFKSQDGIIKFE